MAGLGDDPFSRDPRNVVGNRFFLRVSEELKNMSLNLRGMSMRFSRAPSSRPTTRRQLHTSNLSHLSSAHAAGIAADYHLSPSGKVRMKPTTNPGFDKRAYSHKGAMVQHILNEVQPGVHAHTSVLEANRPPQPPVTLFPEDEDPESEKQAERRIRRFRAIIALTFIVIIALIAGVASASPSRASGNNAGLPIDPDRPTFNPTIAFDVSITVTPSATPSHAPTRRATKSPTLDCFLFFCGRRR